MQPYPRIGSVRAAVVQILLITATATMLLAFTATAQLRFVVGEPALDEFPIVKLPIQLRENASLLNNLNVSQFTITEDGRQVVPLYLDCDTDTIYDELTFLFVLDVSYSMRWQYGTDVDDPLYEKWYAAKTAFAAAINAMRDSDAGALYSLSEFTRREAGYTKDKNELLDALDRMWFLPGTAIYDTIIEVISDALGYGGRQVMILLTDGSDRLSSWSIDDSIDRARNLGIPIFIIGLDVRPSDEPALQRISSETGGQYYYAPSSEELQNVMNAISESILSKECLLVYETEDTCRDGRTRNVKVTVNLPPSVTAQTTFTPPDERERITMQLGEAGKDYADETTYELPFIVSGYLNQTQPLSLDATVVYDPGVLTYVGIASTNGIADNSTVTVNSSVPGTLTVTGTKVPLSQSVQSGSTATLFSLEFDVLYQDKKIVSNISLTNGSIGQDCPGVALPQMIEYSITGCPHEVEVAVDSSVIAYGGNEVVVPVLLLTPIDKQQDLEYEFSMYFDAGYLTFKDIEIDETISSGLVANVHEPVAGTLEITANGGVPTERTGELFRLVFDASVIRDARPVGLSITHGRLAQSCVPLVKTSGEGILLDGTCSKIVRSRSFFLGQNAPNPVVHSNGSSSVVSYIVSGTAPVSLVIYDMDAKPVMTVVEGFQDKGRYTVNIDTSTLPTGTYLYVLREGENMWTRKMVVSR